MTPADYLAEIVTPTFEDFEKKPGERRLAYLACITAAHLDYYVSNATGLSLDNIRKRIRAHGEYSRDALEIVQGISNGTKHTVSDRGRFHFKPGDERHHEPFSFDVEGAGFGEGYWDQPHLSVSHLDPEERARQDAQPYRPPGDYCVPAFPIDGCVRGLIWAYLDTFPELFAGIPRP